MQTFISKNLPDLLEKKNLWSAQGAKQHHMLEGNLVRFDVLDNKPDCFGSVEGAFKVDNEDIKWDKTGFAGTFTLKDYGGTLTDNSPIQIIIYDFKPGEHGDALAEYGTLGDEFIRYQNPDTLSKSDYSVKVNPEGEGICAELKLYNYTLQKGDKIQIILHLALGYQTIGLEHREMGDDIVWNADGSGLIFHGGKLPYELTGEYSVIIEKAK